MSASSTFLKDLGFFRGNWNCLEAGHGKGAADGVGAALKRKADEIVSQGTYLYDGNILYNALNGAEMNVKLFYVDAEAIDDIDKLIKEDLPTIQGTMKLQQCYTDQEGEVSCRAVSCFSPFQFTFPRDAKQEPKMSHISRGSMT